MDYPTPPSQRLLMATAVIEKLGLKRTTFFDLVRKGRFPAAVDVGGGYRRWRECDVDEWLKNLPTHASETHAAARAPKR